VILQLDTTKVLMLHGNKLRLLKGVDLIRLKAKRLGQLGVSLPQEGYAR
jgi:hypothetical protein